MTLFTLNQSLVLEIGITVESIPDDQNLTLKQILLQIIAIDFLNYVCPTKINVYLKHSETDSKNRLKIHGKNALSNCRETNLYFYNVSKIIYS